MVEVSCCPRFYYFNNAGEDVFCLLFGWEHPFAVLFSMMRIAAILFVVNMVLGTSLGPNIRATKAL